MIAMPTTVDTERLRLRAPEPADAVDIFAYASDPRVTRYMVWPMAEDIDDTHDFIGDVAAGWHAGDDYCYVICRDRQSVLGAASCQFGDHGGEIGFILAFEAWGQGYATEAAAALVEQAWRIDDLYRLWATCDVENRASARVLEKLGMRCEGRLARWSPCPNLPEAQGKPRDAFCYALTR